MKYLKVNSRELTALAELVDSKLVTLENFLVFYLDNDKFEDVHITSDEITKYTELKAKIDKKLQEIKNEL